MLAAKNLEEDFCSFVITMFCVLQFNKTAGRTPEQSLLNTCKKQFSLKQKTHKKQTTIYRNSKHSRQSEKHYFLNFIEFKLYTIKVYNFTFNCKTNEYGTWDITVLKFCKLC
jgi:hypothetical protein